MSTPEARARGALPSRGSTSLVIVATVAAGAALYFAQEVFVPAALGLLLTALFRPLVPVLARARIPAPITATLVVLACLAALGAGGFYLTEPLRSWVNQAPSTLAAARSKLEKLRRPIRQVSQAVQKAQQEVTGAPPQDQTQSKAAPPASTPTVPPFIGRVFATTAGIFGLLIQTVVIVFLLLATGDLLPRKVAAVMPKPVTGTAEKTVEAAETVVRRYLLVTALINLGQGVVVALTMWWIGLPTPILWGVLTFFFEFLPYIGALFMVLALTVTGLATFDTIGHILLPPLAYITISTIQNNAVSPFAYGSGLRLNPVVVLFSVLVGWFFWGVAGAFVAVPMLAAIRVFAERSSRESQLATVLAD